MYNFRKPDMMAILDNSTRNCISSINYICGELNPLKLESFNYFMVQKLYFFNL